MLHCVPVKCDRNHYSVKVRLCLVSKAGSLDVLIGFVSLHYSIFGAGTKFL